MGETAIAQGAAVLFGTNVVAIILGAACSLYAGGIRGPVTEGQERRWVRYSLVGLFLTMVALAVPLGSVLVSQITQQRGR